MTQQNVVPAYLSEVHDSERDERREKEDTVLSRGLRHGSISRGQNETFFSENEGVVYLHIPIFIDSPDSIADNFNEEPQLFSVTTDTHSGHYQPQINVYTLFKGARHSGIKEVSECVRNTAGIVVKGRPGSRKTDNFVLLKSLTKDSEMSEKSHTVESLQLVFEETHHKCSVQYGVTHSVFSYEGESDIVVSSSNDAEAEMLRILFTESFSEGFLHVDTISKESPLYKGDRNNSNIVGYYVFYDSRDINKEQAVQIRETFQKNSKMIQSLSDEIALLKSTGTLFAITPDAGSNSVFIYYVHNRTVIEGWLSLSQLSNLIALINQGEVSRFRITE